MSNRDDFDHLKETLAELGWTSSVSTAPNLACEALRTLNTALERHRAEAETARAEIWKYKNALRDALDLAEACIGIIEIQSDGAKFVEKLTAKLGELQKVLAP